MHFSLALKLCSKSKHKQHYHGVIVTSGGAIKSMGYNHEVIHAEVHALSKLWPSERKGCKVYSFRFTKGGKFGNAKPCHKCEKFLRDNGIKTVYYTTNGGDLERMKL